MKTKHLIKRVLPYYRKYIGILIFDLFCATLTILCEIFFPLIIRYITDTATTDLSALTWQIILIIGTIYLVLRIIDTVANYFMQNIGHVMGARMETDMRADMFYHLTKQSFNYFNNTKVGTLMSRLTSDLFEVTEFAHHCPEEFYIATLKICLSFGILASFNLYLTLIIFSLIPIMVLCTRYFNTKMGNAWREQRKILGEINAQAEDSLLGIRVVKSFANEGEEVKKFNHNNDKFLKTKKKGYKYMAGFHSVVRIFDGLMYIAVVVAGALFLIYKQISLGDFTAYLLFVTMLLQAVRRLIEFIEQFTRGMTGLERFVEVMDAPAEIVDDETAKDMPITNGHIVFQNVSFSYPDNSGTQVIKSLDLDIACGENVAIVGSSGGGKTTLCNLIPRFYELEKGEITIDGISINDFTLSSLRIGIGTIQQDVYLFSGTVYENIAYGKIDCSRDEVIDAAKAAMAHEFIMSLPNGYDTYVGERGVKLSGGQKQRISIARVFLKSPAILILDEATSALDNESEKIVKSSFEQLAHGRTTITIAHRLTTVKNADRIIVLDKGIICEIGTHDELMAKKGIYYNLNL